MPSQTLRQEGIDPRLVKVLSHPLRTRILRRLCERVASPNQIAQELGAPLGNVSYHTRILLDYECIELVDTQPRRGAIEHFYRGIIRPWLDEDAWAQLPPALRSQLAGQTLLDLWEDARAAGEAGAFERTSVHVTRTTLELDEDGWDRLAALLDATLEEAMRIQAESSNRRAGGGGNGESVRAELGLLFFERA
jgi:DNA-binding transcriptional ArsR family regulator